ncbi:MAG: FAD-dependent oxidoreductase [Opitutaceae bacterium]|jgi:uncharacterized protein|nr:FAD-dependent oxidoreductase [Opitutaceae bacterium]
MLGQTPQLVDIILSLEKSEDEEAWAKALAKKLKCGRHQIGEIRLRKHSIDARKKDIRVRLRLEVAAKNTVWVSDPQPIPEYPKLPPDAPSVIVVGAGPAGLFAALRLVEKGVKPIVLERGKNASARRFDLAPILREGRIVEDSNYCFGEGGAGTFSDGKLYTRATKRGSVASVYQTLVAHGAPERILIDAHPHIGSNLLPKVVMAMRESVISAGGEVRFNYKVSKFLFEQDTMIGVSNQEGDEIKARAVILATGHSARDVYQLLHSQNIRLEPKSFAVGVRIEHPQQLVDERQYHLKPNSPRGELLPAASYTLATKIKGRGVHSFCMCPGGFIVPAATENDEIVVNGMSLSRRDSPFANSGFVVSVEPEDTHLYHDEYGVLSGIAFQKELEKSAKQVAGGQIAPAQLIGDFLSGKISDKTLPTSYFPGVAPARLDQLLPLGISERLKIGIKLFDRKLQGFGGHSAQLIGFETRTSSPVRIPRNPETLEHIQIKGLYPCGEGAGYAGGIVSAALDGIRCAEAASSR